MKNIIAIVLVSLVSGFASAEVVDETIVSAEQTKKAWNAETVAKHEIWQKPACSAYTMSEDGESTLEVVAFYNAATDTFGEPEVNVVTTANFSFLDVTTSTNATSREFQMLPLQPTNTNLVGARVLIGEREDLVVAIRRHSNLTARYLDAAGEVKSVTFSLRGSSDAVAAAFSHCDLQFLPELKLPDAL